jgi:hypothetical protein
VNRAVPEWFLDTNEFDPLVEDRPATGLAKLLAQTGRARFTICRVQLEQLRAAATKIRRVAERDSTGQRKPACHPLEPFQQPRPASPEAERASPVAEPVEAVVGERSRVGAGIAADTSQAAAFAAHVAIADRG